jgi:hypothetical protein
MSFYGQDMSEIFNSKRIVPAAILLFAFNLGTAQTSTTTKQAITIKLLNGKTGHPVWWRGLASVRVGSAINRRDLDPVDKRTNLLGEAKVEVSDASPPQVEVGVDFISRDCRYSPQSQSNSLVYSIDEIRAKGIVSENYCGGPKRTPKPGVLMIYVIPSTLRELWNN